MRVVTTAGPNAGQVALEFDQVSRGFGRRKIIDRLSFAVGGHEIVALVGPSGSGKSTILNIAGLLEAPDSGQVRLFGTRAPRVGTSQARHFLRYRIGYLFQNSALIEQDSIEANLKVAQLYGGGTSDEKASKRAEALASVGLGMPQQRKVYELSGGEQQRLAMARLLLKPSGFVLADEPTGSLDPDNRDGILELIGRLREGGKAVLLVTHDPVVAAAADRVVSL